MTREWEGGEAASGEPVRGAAVAGSPADAKTGALVLLCLAQFLLVMDIAIVNVALPSIQRDLDFAPSTLGLVVTTYALAVGGFLLLGGRAADLVGRRRLFVAGMALFTCASLVCGVAPSAGILIAARVVQGLGGALMAPVALSLLTTIFPSGAERNRALGVWSALAAAGGAVGLLVGGIVTDAASWRWVFLLNVPIGVGALVASFRLLPGGRPTRAGVPDVGGAVAVTLGLIALVLGLQQVGQAGAWLPTLLLVVAAGAFAVFVRVERRAADPLVPFALFRSRALTGANLVTLLMSAVILGVNYFLTLYLQQTLHYSPLQTGLAFLPNTLLGAIASAVTARVLGRVPVRTLLLGGMLALGVGAALLALLPEQGNYLLDVLPGLALFAVGLGVGYTVGTLAATAGVASALQGAASGIVTTSQQIGGAVGLALLSSVASAASLRADGAALPGWHAAFWVMAGFAALAVVLTVALLRESAAAPGDGAQASAEAAPSVPTAALSARSDARGAGSPSAHPVPVAASVHACVCMPAVARLAASSAET